MELDHFCFARLGAAAGASDYRLYFFGGAGRAIEQEVGARLRELFRAFDELRGFEDSPEPCMSSFVRDAERIVALRFFKTHGGRYAYHAAVVPEVPGRSPEEVAVAVERVLADRVSLETIELEGQLPLGSLTDKDPPQQITLTVAFESRQTPANVVDFGLSDGKSEPVSLRRYVGNESSSLLCVSHEEDSRRAIRDVLREMLSFGASFSAALITRRPKRLVLPSEGVLAVLPETWRRGLEYSGKELYLRSPHEGYGSPAREGERAPRREAVERAPEVPPRVAIADPLQRLDWRVNETLEKLDLLLREARESREVAKESREVAKESREVAKESRVSQLLALSRAMRWQVVTLAVSVLSLGGIIKLAADGAGVDAEPSIQADSIEFLLRDIKSQMLENSEASGEVRSRVEALERSARKDPVPAQESRPVRPKAEQSASKLRRDTTTAGDTVQKADSLLGDSDAS